MTEQTLVSVVVISYHSEDYIVETLNSIYDQTYQRIELIVADDASTDHTADVAKAWIAEKGSRFENCILRVNEKNQGIPGNLNSAIELASGTYIKIIAADDLLLPECIRCNTEECEQKGYDSLCTWLVKFTDTLNGRRQWSEEPPQGFFDASAQDQRKMLLKKNYVYGSIFFFKKAYWQQLGKYDERYRMLEDYPMFWKISNRGDHLNFLNVPTVAYRISQTSISNGSGQRVVNVNYFKCYRRFFYDNIYPELLRNRMFFDLLRHWRDFFYRWMEIWLGNDRGRRSVRLVEYFHQRNYLPSRKRSQDV